MRWTSVVMMTASLGACATAPGPQNFADLQARMAEAQPRPHHVKRKTTRAEFTGTIPADGSSTESAFDKDVPESGDYAWLDRENARLARATTICTACAPQLAAPSAPAPSTTR